MELSISCNCVWVVLILAFTGTSRFLSSSEVVCAVYLFGVSHDRNPPPRELRMPRQLWLWLKFDTESSVLELVFLTFLIIRASRCV